MFCDLFCITFSWNLILCHLHLILCYFHLILMEDTFPSFLNKCVCQLTGEDNFHSWKQQVLLVVSGLNLEDYFFEIIHIRHMIDDKEGIKVINPKYYKFSQRDIALASWLLASISTPISKGLVGCMATTSIWSKLHQHFS